FKSMGIIPESRKAWLSEHPSERFVFAMNYVQANYHYSPFIFKLGNEVDYFTREQKQILSSLFQASLEDAFATEQTCISYEIMAQGMSGIFIEVFMRWFEAPQEKTASAIAHDLHHLIRSLLLQGIHEKQ